MRTLPVVGPIIFGQDILVYISWALVIALIWYLNRTRLGLNVRAVGESPAAADAMGINVAGYRYAHTIAGGALAGVAGATFTLAITPQWVNGITGGAGWIAIALVIFAFWRPELCLVGAYFFGALQALAPGAAGAADQPRADRALDELAAVHRDRRRARRDLDGEHATAPWRTGGARAAVRTGGTVNEQPIGSWLEELGSSAPAPGGGAAAALEVAMGAALVEMVCNLTIGKPAFAEHEALMTEVRDRCAVLRVEATGLAAEDADAFTAVIAAYRLPKEQEDRRRAHPGGARRRSGSAAADGGRRLGGARPRRADRPRREPERRERRSRSRGRGARRPAGGAREHRRQPRLDHRRGAAGRARRG